MVEVAAYKVSELGNSWFLGFKGRTLSIVILPGFFCLPLLTTVFRKADSGLCVWVG